MGTASRRRRQKDRRRQRQLAEANVSTPNITPPVVHEPVTDISALIVSPDEVRLAGTASEPLVWYVASCEPMKERKAIDGLRERRIAAYLPMHRMWRWTRGRKRLIESPLFVGYVFVGLTPKQSVYDLLRIHGIDGLIEVQGKPARIDCWLIVQVAALEADGQFDHTGSKTPQYATKQKLKITAGQFAGLIGEMIGMKGEDRLRLMLSGAHIHGEFTLPVNDVAPTEDVAPSIAA